MADPSWPLPVSFSGAAHLEPPARLPAGPPPATFLKRSRSPASSRLEETPFLGWGLKQHRSLSLMCVFWYFLGVVSVFFFFFFFFNFFNNNNAFARGVLVVCFFSFFLCVGEERSPEKDTPWRSRSFRNRENDVSSDSNGQGPWKNQRGSQ